MLKRQNIINDGCLNNYGMLKLYHKNKNNARKKGDLKMFNKYLLIGATGFLGNTIVWTLHQKGLK